MPGKESLVPRIVFYVYAISTIIPCCMTIVSLIPTLFDISIYLKPISTALSIFGVLLLTYIFYIALNYIRLHKLRFSDFINRSEIVVSDKISEIDASSFRAILEIMGNRIRRIPRRTSPIFIAPLVSVLYIIGHVTVELASRYVLEITPEAFLEFPLSSEALMEFVMYTTTMSIGSILLLVSVILCIYILHILNRDLYELESIEDEMISTLRPLASKIGLKLPYREVNIAKRNTILYAILYIVTLGLFGVYWVYRVAIRDPEEHVKEDYKVYSELPKILAITPQ
ncbi:MAG: hypothetical protein DRJ49_02655 [Thermoprotei archaeon]|nr:MAG: hypothetical protein DRN53_03150 [Thermoprotei archaeon]RLE89536.1 MAG: hypothetical protein DRJ49_02655 [Thermoprotei archaeon]